MIYHYAGYPSDQPVAVVQVRKRQGFREEFVEVAVQEAGDLLVRIPIVLPRRWQRKEFTEVGDNDAVAERGDPVPLLVVAERLPNPDGRRLLLSPPGLARP
jgi:hypothetical protein